LERAILLARIQQQVLDKGKVKWQRPPPRLSQPVPKGDVKAGVPHNNLWKERQTRDYRRANGLCYFCAEPYDSNHKNVCTKKPQATAQINALALNNLEVVLTEEVLNELAIEDAITENFGQLSLNALAGTDVGEAMKIRALVNNKVMLILVDSGSSHSFVNQAFLSTAGQQALPMPPQQVKLPNGEIPTYDHMVPKLEWWANGHTLQSHMKILPLGPYDAY
jgi:hypothetical protein